MSIWIRQLEFVSVGRNNCARATQADYRWAARRLVATRTPHSARPWHERTPGRLRDRTVCRRRTRLPSRVSCASLSNRGTRPQSNWTTSICPCARLVSRLVVLATLLWACCPEAIRMSRRLTCIFSLLLIYHLFDMLISNYDLFLFN